MPRHPSAKGVTVETNVGLYALSSMRYAVSKTPFLPKLMGMQKMSWKKVDLIANHDSAGNGLVVKFVFGQKTCHAVALLMKRLLDCKHLTETLYPGPTRRIAIEVLKVSLAKLCENHCPRLRSLFLSLRAQVAFWSLRWMPDRVIKGWLPGLKIHRSIAL